MLKFLKALWWTVKLISLFIWTMAQVVAVIVGVVLVVVGIFSNFIEGPRG